MNRMCRSVAFCLLAVLTLPRPGQAVAQEKPSTPELQDLTALMQAVDTAQQAGKPSGDLVVSWRGEHYFRSQGDSIYIPFTVDVDRQSFTSPAIAMYLRVVDRAAPPPAPGTLTKFAWEAAQTANLPADGQLSRAMALPPGSYDVFVAVKDARAAGAPSKVALLQHALVVPSLASPELHTSSIVLASALEQLPAALPQEKQQDNPYVFGPLKVTPASTKSFPASGELHLFFMVYGAADTGGKPDVQVDLSFHRRVADGEKYFNRTNAQELNARTLAPEFNLALGHQLMSRSSVPLATFPPGEYRVEITVTDKLSGKSLTSNVNFAVSPSRGETTGGPAAAL